MQIKQLLIVFSLILLPVFSSAEGFFSKHIDISEGLSQPSVTSIISDIHGTVWIGTRFGLNKYRSNAIARYGPGNGARSLPGSYVNGLYLDSCDNLWAYTESGLSRYDKASDIFRPVAGELIYSACEYDGRIYFGGRTGIHSYDMSSGKFHPMTVSLPKSYIINMMPLSDGRILVVDKGLGLFLFDPSAQRLDPLHIDGLEEAIIMSACMFGGCLHLSVFNRGLFVLDEALTRIQNRYDTGNSGLTFDIILSMLEVDGALWMGTDGGGICILDNGSITTLDSVYAYSPDALPSNSISSLYADGQGNVWAGSVRNGAYCLKSTSVRSFPMDGTEAGDNVVISLWMDSAGDLWIGTDGGGVKRYAPASEGPVRIAGTDGLKISSLTELDASRMLLSVYGQGLCSMDKATGRISPFIIINNEINAAECSSGGSPMLYTLEDGKVLICAIRAWLYDPARHRFSRFNQEPADLDVGEMKLFARGPRGFLYAFSHNGLFRLDTASMTIRQIAELSETDALNTAAMAPDGTIWLGTDYGLKYIPPHGGDPIPFENSLFTRVTQLKAEKDGILWIAADNILFCKNGGRIEIIDESDGFSANEILSSTYYNKRTADAVYFGGTSGFVEISRPVGERTARPQWLELYEVDLGDGSVQCTTGETIRIPWNYHSLSVGVNLRGIDPFHKELYRFWVSGDNSQSMTETFLDRIPLTGLTEGTYRVDASYLHRDGSWGDPVNILNIIVLPPWYRTWWFYGFLIILAAAALAGALFRHSRMSQRNLARTLSRWVTTSTVSGADISSEGTKLNPSEEDLMSKINRLVEDHMGDNDLSVAKIAAGTAMSRASLYSKVKSITGMGVAQYIEDVRLRRACKLLKDTSLSIAEISEQVGFSTPNYFSSRFKQAVGISPLTFRREIKEEIQ